MNPAPPDVPDRFKGLTFSAHSGYLQYVPGQLISAGSHTLPPPSESERQKPQRTVDLHVPDLGGKIRIIYELKKFRHYRSSYWLWLAVRADAITEDGQPVRAL